MSVNHVKQVTTWIINDVCYMDVKLERMRCAKHVSNNPIEEAILTALAATRGTLFVYLSEPPRTQTDTLTHAQKNSFELDLDHYVCTAYVVFECVRN